MWAPGAWSARSGALSPRDAAGRLAAPEEIAGTVAFLASDDAGHLMGAGPEGEPGLSRRSTRPPPRHGGVEPSVANEPNPR
jgi:hypothetical protein